MVIEASCGQICVFGLGFSDFPEDKPGKKYVGFPGNLDFPGNPGNAARPPGNPARPPEHFTPSLVPVVFDAWTKFGRLYDPKNSQTLVTQMMLFCQKILNMGQASTKLDKIESGERFRA